MYGRVDGEGTQFASGLEQRFVISIVGQRRDEMVG